MEVRKRLNCKSGVEWGGGGADGRKEQQTRTIRYPEGAGMTARRKKKSRTKQRKTVMDQQVSVAGGKSVLPVFLDSEAPFPGQMVVFVVVGELGLDVVIATGQHPFGGFLHRGEELVLLVRSGPVAADHVLRLVNCTGKTKRGCRE